MKIALISSLFRPVTKNSIAGTETWNYNYAESLHNENIDVTLYACKQSKISGTLRTMCDNSDVYDKKGEISAKQQIFLSLNEMINVAREQDNYDIIHISAYGFYYHLPLIELIHKPCVLTFHENLADFNPKFIKKIFDKFSQTHFVFISNSVAKKLSPPKHYQTIHNGINLSDFSFNGEKDEYYFWMGRLVPEKGVEDSIIFAQKTNSKLIIAGPADDGKYFNENVRPYLNDKIKYVGELGLKEKEKYYAKAKAFLMTVKWDEAFGLAVVEANACGTPVIGYKRGALNETIENGRNGFLVEPDSIEGLITASKQLEKIKYSECRNVAEEKFSIQKMTSQYLSLYSKILK